MKKLFSPQGILKQVQNDNYRGFTQDTCHAEFISAIMYLSGFMELIEALTGKCDFWQAYMRKKLLCSTFVGGSQSTTTCTFSCLPFKKPFRRRSCFQEILTDICLTFHYPNAFFGSINAHPGVPG
jgi:hypothetical protein